MGDESGQGFLIRAVAVVTGVVNAIGSVLLLAFASVFVVIFGGGVGLMWLDPQGLQATSPLPLSEKLMMTGLFFAGVWLFRWMGVPVRRVVSTPDGIRISGLGRSEVVPYAEIEDIDQFTWAHPRMITLRLARRTSFGRTIRFRPRAWFALPMLDGEDAEVVEIRDRSMRARTLGRGVVG